MKLLLGLLISCVLIPCIANAQYEWRSLDGYGNSLVEPERGAAHVQMLSLCRAGFEDGLSIPKSASMPNPRAISNEIFDQLSPKPSSQNLNDLWWSFGQFVDHDIALSENSPVEFMGIAVPAGDPAFDPNGTGGAMIPMMRSAGTPDATGVRRYENTITAFVDGSNVYGSDQARADYLRSFEGGKLRVNAGNIPPFNTLNGEYGAPIDPDAPVMERSSGGAAKFLICGDVRANENSLLASIHTLWVREHNRLCDSLVNTFPGSSDEELYQHARMLVGAQLQQIVFAEWLPALGVELDPYFGYDSDVNPGISNEFAAAGFRFGHTLVSSELKLVDELGFELPSSPLSLSDVFFDPIAVIQQNGVEALLRGASKNHQQELDCGLVSDLRNMLFGPPGAGGIDLAAININRGRDRGLASFNEMRIDLGLDPYPSFRALTLESENSAKLTDLYAEVDDLDAWVGFLAENQENGLGETLRLVLSDQFGRLRDGDRLYFEASDAGFSGSEIAWVKRQRLSDVIRRNAGGLSGELSFTVEEAVSSVSVLNDEEPISINRTKEGVLIYGLAAGEAFSLSIYNQIGQRLSFEQTRADGFGESRALLNSSRIESVVCVVQLEDGRTISRQVLAW
ncbi:MAG: peroxidase family protein [Saprospiraceae bacterium]